MALDSSYQLVRSLFIVYPLKSKNAYGQDFWKFKHVSLVVLKPANANPAD